jgi:hypothetical protein
MIMKQQIKRIEREMRLCSLRTFSFGIAIASGVTALFAAGGLPLSNIEAWSSSFVVMSHSGLLQKSFIPLAIITIIFLVIGLILHFIIKKMENTQ